MSSYSLSIAAVAVFLVSSIDFTNSSHLTTAGNLYYLTNSNLRNSNHIPNGSRWSSVLNQTAPAYPQLHFFCERLAMFDLTSTLQRNIPSNMNIIQKSRALNLTMNSVCSLWEDCSAYPEAHCGRQANDCPDMESFLTKMRRYCPKVLLANDKLWLWDLGSTTANMS